MALSRITNPFLSSSGAGNASITSPAANTVAFTTATTERMRIDSSGDVEIGTTAPLTTTANRTYLAIKGKGTAAGDGNGILQFQTNAAGSTGPNIGNIEWSLPDNSSSSSLRVAYISVSAEGTTANNRGSNMSFATKVDGSSSAGVERMRLNANGNLSLQGGTLTASGVGITFPATQSASSDANCLDDYEEGTWTPTVTSGTGSITTVVVGGHYRKVGGLVSLQFTYQITNNGTGASSVTIAGLPFTNTVGANVSAGVMREIAVNGQTGSIYFNSATTLLAVNYVSAYPGGANHYWVGSICYYAA